MEDAGGTNNNVRDSGYLARLTNDQIQRFQRSAGSGRCNRLRADRRREDDAPGAQFPAAYAALLTTQARRLCE